MKRDSGSRIMMNPEIQPPDYNQFVSERGPRPLNSKTIVFATYEMVQLDIQMQKNECGPPPHSRFKN